MLRVSDADNQLQGTQKKVRRIIQINRSKYIYIYITVRINRINKEKE